MKTTFNPRFAVLLGFIIVSAAIRFLNFNSNGLLINFTPIGAMALFGGAYFNRNWKSLLLPLTILFISDIILLSVFYDGKFGILYEGWYWVYFTFMLIVCYGKWFLKRITVKNLLLTGTVASLTHWLITDLGVWLSGGLDITTGLPYTRDIEGLIKCYVLALPYLRSFFLGTAFYGAVLFGLFELAQRRFPVLSVQQAQQ